MVLPCLCTALNVRYNNALQTKAETPNESQINWRQRQHFMKTLISEQRELNKFCQRKEYCLNV